MIIGSGLIGTAFKQSLYRFDNCTIFASGVSDSKLSQASEFQRELNLLKGLLAHPQKFVYFSSIHTLDPSQASTCYVKHKIEIENYIKQNSNDFLIYRLPLIIGRGGNPNSLFNYLYRSITNSTCITIYKNAHRYVMAVNDVVELVHETINSRNIEINLVFNKPYGIMQILAAYEKVLKKQAVYRMVDGGEYFEVDNSLLRNILADPKILQNNTDISYLENILFKLYRS